MSWGFLLLACQAERVSSLEARLFELELAQAELLEHQAVLERKIDILRRPKAEIKPEADALLQSLREAKASWDMPAALPVAEQLSEFYPHTQAGQHAMRVLPELETAGSPLPELEGVRWMTSAGQYAPVTVLYFFEEWCPLCREGLATLVQQHEALKSESLAIIALTSITRTSTPDKVQQLLSELGVAFPAGEVLDRQIHESLRVQGIPAAAVFVDGTVRWRGNGAKLDWERIARAAQR